MATRQKRYEDGVKKDSVKARNDSIMLDYVRRNADQFFQMKLTNDSIKNELKLIKEHH